MLRDRQAHYSKIIVTGSLSYDHIMAMPGRFKDHILPDKLHILNVSFIMEEFRKGFGGTGGNIAYTLGLLNSKTQLIAAAGNDFSPYLKHLKAQVNLDIKGVKQFPNESTATGFAMTDRDDNQVWGFYQGAMKFTIKTTIKPSITKSSFVMLAPNDVPSVNKYVKEAIHKKADYMFDPAFNIVHFSKRELVKAINYAHIIIGNDYEIALLIKRSGMTYSKLLTKARILISTLGSKGSIIRTATKKIIIPAAKVVSADDPTGAGDCYRAGFLAGYIRGFDFETCGKMGSIAAAYTVEKYGTQTHKFTISQFRNRYKQNYKQDLPIN